MRSLMSRLEALEKRVPDHLVLCVTMDGKESIMNVSEYERLPEPRPDVRVISGGNLKEAGRLLDAIIGKEIADVINSTW